MSKPEKIDLGIAPHRFTKEEARAIVELGKKRGWIREPLNPEISILTAPPEINIRTPDFSK